MNHFTTSFSPIYRPDVPGMSGATLNQWPVMLSAFFFGINDYVTTSTILGGSTVYISLFCRDELHRCGGTISKHLFLEFVIFF